MLTAIILSGNSTPTHLRLWNLGFEAEDGQIILEKLFEKEFGGLEELALHMNPEFWESVIPEFRNS